MREAVAMSTGKKVGLVIVFASVVFRFVAAFGLLPGLIAMAVVIVRFAIRTAMLWAVVVVMKKNRSQGTPEQGSTTEKQSQTP
jgi:hypothetical protein